MNIVRLTAIATSALLTVGSFQATANAQGVTETVKVNVYPYELATSDGRVSALGRIEKAAAQLCAPEQRLYSRSQRSSCEKRTSEQMVRQTQSTALYAMWVRHGAIETASRD